MKKQPLLRIRRRNGEAGFSMIEYVVGAGALLAIITAGIAGMSGSLNEMFTDLGQWAEQQVPDPS